MLLNLLRFENWRTISFISRYFDTAEKRYLSKELELVAVAWRADFFRNFVIGRKCSVKTNHERQKKEKNTALCSHLFAWIDRLIRHKVTTEHIPWVKIGFALSSSQNTVGEGIVLACKIPNPQWQKIIHQMVL